MSVVDTAIVGSSSAAELAALGPATMLVDSSAYLFFWLNVATTSLFATALAASKADEAYDTLSDALYVALFCGLGITIVLSCLGPAALAVICKSAPAVIPSATKYLRIRVLGLPAFMVGTVLQASCLGAKDSISPLIVLVICGLLNLVLDLILVNGCAMGIGGAALATLAAQVLQTALLAYAVQRKRRRVYGSMEPKSNGATPAASQETGWMLLRGQPSLPRIRTFLAFAGPMALVLCGKIACYNSMTLAATTSVASLAAHQVLISVFFVGCKFGDAVSQTAQAYLPACYPQPPMDDETAASAVVDAAVDATAPDAKDSSGALAKPLAVSSAAAEATLLDAPPAAARRLGRRLLRLATGLGAFVSTLAYAIAIRFPTLFTSAPNVIGTMASCAPLLFLALVLHAPTMTAEGLLIGSLEVDFLAKAYAVNVCVFLSALYVVSSRQLGLLAVWSALAAFQLVRLSTFLLRLRHTRLA